MSNTASHHSTYCTKPVAAAPVWGEEGGCAKRKSSDESGSVQTLSLLLSCSYKPSNTKMNGQSMDNLILMTRLGSVLVVTCIRPLRISPLQPLPKKRCLFLFLFLCHSDIPRPGTASPRHPMSTRQSSKWKCKCKWKWKWKFELEIEKHRRFGLKLNHASVPVPVPVPLPLW